jgi:uncharacterized protein (TIGR03435 family)
VRVHHFRESSSCAAVLLLSVTVVLMAANVIAAMPRLQTTSSSTASTDASQSMRFEVVSIKLRAQQATAAVANPGPRSANAAGGILSGPCGGGVIQLSPRRFAVSNITVYKLIALAFGTNCRASAEIGLLQNGPGWLRSDTYDIQAIIPYGTPTYVVHQLNEGRAPELQAMLQHMLADNFSLSVHKDVKVGPAYNLVIAKPGQLKLSEDQNDTSVDGGPPSESAASASARTFSLRIDPSGGTATVVAKRAPLSLLIDVLQGLDGRFVIDKTGFKGLIDIPSQTFDIGPFMIGNASVWPEILRLLGMKLERTQAPIQVLTIDDISKPAEI